MSRNDKNLNSKIKIKTPTTWQRPQLLLHQSQAQFQPNYSRLPEPEQPTIWKDAGSVRGEANR